MAAAEQGIFLYKGVSKQGKPIQGEIRGDNANVVRAQLRKQGITPKNVRKKPKPLFKRDKPIKPADIALFTRQLATMMKAGVPLVQSFDIVAEGTPKEKLRAMIIGIRDDVSAGVSFATSLRKYPRYFDDLFCSLVDAGETSGALEQMLERVATYKEKSEALKAKIKKALTYPAAVVTVAIIVTAILLVKVVPVFAKVFGGFGAQLPAFTLFVLHISEVAQDWWIVVMITLILLGVSFKEAKFRSPKFADFVDAATLKIPIIGSIIHEATVARFARTLATTFAAGVPLIDSLDSVAGSSGNAVFRDATLRIKDDVSGGIQLNAAIRATGLFPILLIQMTTIGEESGALDDMMEKAAVHFETSVDNQVDNLTALLEPLIMSILAVLVGGLLIAMYLPIFQLGSVI